MLAASTPYSGVRSVATPRTIVALMLREMVTTYGRSPGGYIWAIVEPVAAIALLSFVFSIAFRSPPLGDNFPLFYASAYLPFMLFLDVNNKLATAIKFSRPLLAYPSVTMVDVLLARFLLNALTHLMVFLAVIPGIIIAFGLRPNIEILVVANALGMAAILALGFGTLNCYLFTAFPVYERLWQIVTRPLVIVSGIFFLFESIPGLYQDVLWYNPIFHITGEMRSGIYASYDANYVDPVFVYGIGLITMAFGLLILKSRYREVVND